MSENNENNKNYFANNLKYLRNTKKMGQIELANLLGRKSSSSISAWEKGDYTPKAGILKDIADIFGINLSELMEIDLKSSNGMNLVKNEEIIYGDNKEINENENTVLFDKSDMNAYNSSNSEKYTEFLQYFPAVDINLQKSLLKKIDKQIAIQEETNLKLEKLIDIISNFIKD